MTTMMMKVPPPPGSSRSPLLSVAPRKRMDDEDMLSHTSIHSRYSASPHGSRHSRRVYIATDDSDDDNDSIYDDESDCDEFAEADESELPLRTPSISAAPTTRTALAQKRMANACKQLCLSDDEDEDDDAAFDRNIFLLPHNVRVDPGWGSGSGSLRGSSHHNSLVLEDVLEEEDESDDEDELDFCNQSRECAAAAPTQEQGLPAKSAHTVSTTNSSIALDASADKIDSNSWHLSDSLHEPRNASLSSSKHKEEKKQPSMGKLKSTVSLQARKPAVPTGTLL